MFVALYVLGTPRCLESPAKPPRDQYEALVEGMALALHLSYRRAMGRKRF
jgi:hypothetical protein